MYLKERLSTIEIARILKNHSIDSHVTADGKIFAHSSEYDVNKKEWFDIDVDLTDCTVKHLRDWLGY